MKAFVGSHFMFNILNQIQNRFLSDQDTDGVQVMSYYNKMLRYALKCSESGVTTAAEEWQFLNIYLSAEQLRFEGELQYHLNSGEDDSGYIPAFLLQPVVEAMLHASLASDNQSAVKVIFKNQGSNALYEIGGSNLIENIPEKYTGNITRVKERIGIWNKSKETSITLTAKGDFWILSMT